jgi:hypothetical protein
MDKRKFSPLAATEIAWRNAQLESARKIVSQMSPADAWNPIRLEPLDRSWTLWMARDEKENQEINAHINAFGIAFGELLVESGVFDWIIVSDEYGTDKRSAELSELFFLYGKWRTEVGDFVFML